MTVLDWADAFHSMGVAPSEFPHQIVKGFGGEYVGYEAVLFGGAGSPGVWGRAAAFLGRSGQSLFAADEARIQVYVDDPWSIWRGDAEARARNFDYLLLWWRGFRAAGFLEENSGRTHSQMDRRPDVRHRRRSQGGDGPSVRRGPPS